MLQTILMVVVILGVGVEAYMAVRLKYNRNIYLDILFVGICLINLLSSVSLLVLSFA